MTFRDSISWRLRAGATLLLIAPVSIALADDDSPERENKRWEVMLGAGAMSKPEYPGSDEDEVRPVPVMNIRYGRYFLGGIPGGGGAGLGAQLFDGDRWSFGAVVGLGLGELREEKDDRARLQGLGDVDDTTRAGFFASYEITDWLEVSTNALQDIGGNDLGLTASLELEASFQPLPRLRLSAGPGVTWGDDEYAMTLFGINAAQSLRSGRAQFDPGSSVTLAQLSFGAQYALTPKWSVGSRITASRLLGDAADSPIVQDKNQNSYALFMLYRF